MDFYSGELILKIGVRVSASWIPL